MRHELFHNYISEEVLQASDEVIRESMTAEEYDAMYESYRDAYASIYDFENMSEDEIERLLTEEIAADAYAGLNWFSGRRAGAGGRARRDRKKRPGPEGRGAAGDDGTAGQSYGGGIGARTGRQRRPAPRGSARKEWDGQRDHPAGNGMVSRNGRPVAV